MLDLRQILEKSTGPILFYFGNEGGIEDFYNNSGAMFDMAPKFDALLVFLEHRYYGVSLPDATLTSEGLRYLTIEQALADTTVFLSNKNALFGCADIRSSLLLSGLTLVTIEVCGQ